MINDNHTFCRLLLKEVMKTVRKHISKKDIEKSYAWKGSIFVRSMEFHGPNDFYWHGQACCLWHAKAQGWEAYLRKMVIED